MALEDAIETLRLAIQELTATLKSAPPNPQTTPSPALAAVIAPSAAPIATVTAAPTMPPPPDFLNMGLPAPAAPAAPFGDAAGLATYAMTAYKSIAETKGAGKAAEIQQVLKGLGVVNLIDVKPEQYGAFYAGVEALKA